MKYVLGTVAILAVLVIGIGFYQSWWAIEADSRDDGVASQVDVSLKIDKEKAKEDLKEAGAATSEVVESAKQGLSDLAESTKEGAANLADSASQTRERVTEAVIGTTMIGIVQSVDAEARTLTIKSKDDQTLQVTVPEDADIEDAGDNDQSLSSIQTGERVSVTYGESDGKNVATDIQKLPQDEE